MGAPDNLLTVKPHRTHTKEGCDSMNMRFLVPAIAAITLLNGCAEKFGRLTGEKTTAVRFADTKGRAAAATLNGGVMVYAMRADGFRASFALTSEADAREVMLPNGTYQFRAVGWDTALLSGGTRCGFGMGADGTANATFTLSGQATQVPLHLTTATCGNGLFARADFTSSNVFMNPQIAFCGATTNIDAKTTAQACQDGEESFRFFKGRTASGGISESDYNPQTQRLVYMADTHEAGRTELFSVGIDGRSTVKQNPKLVGGGDVTWFQLVPNSDLVIYQADQDTDNKQELYVSRIGVPGAVNLVNSVPSGAPGIKAFEVSPDGTRVVFVGEMANPGKDEIYSVALTGAFPATYPKAPAPLYGTVAGIGVTPGSDGKPLFRISPNSQKVLFVGKFMDPSKAELYVSPIGGGGETRLNSGSTPSTFQTRQAEFTYDSNIIVWRGDYLTTANQMQATLVAFPNTSFTLSPLNVTNFTLSPTGPKLLFSWDDGTDSKLEYADFTVPASPVTSERHVGPTTSTFQAVRFVDNTKAIYLSDADSPGILHLYRTGFSGPSDKEQLSPADLSMSIMNTNVEEVIQIAGSNAYFPGVTTTNAYLALYAADLNGGANNAQLVSHAPSSTIDFLTYKLGGGKAYYSMDVSTDGTHEVFSYNPAATPPGLSPLVTSGVIKSVEKIHFPPPAAGFPLPNAILFEGIAQGSTSTRDFFLMPDRGMAGTGIRPLTHVHAGANGVGRFKFRMLSYRATPGGGPVETGAGLESDCFYVTAGAGDGGLSDLVNLRLPPGDGSPNSPFAIALDVYGEATDCNGPYSRVLFPNGLAPWTTPPANTRVKVATSGGTATAIFLRD